MLYNREKNNDRVAPAIGLVDWLRGNLSVFLKRTPKAPQGRAR